MATTLLPAGALGDDRGRKRVLVAGAVLLAAASAGCALAPNPAVFLAGALAQGVGSAAIMARSLGLIAHAFPEGPARHRATGIWGASLGSGIGIGPWLAAGLEPVAGWQGFVLSAVFAVALALAAQILLVESTAPGPRPVDPAGMVLLGSAVGALIGGLVRGRTGWTDPPTLALLGAAVALMTTFALVEARGRHPMLDLALFRSPRFVAATLASAAMGLGMIAVLSYISTAVPRGLGSGALAGAGLVTGWSAAGVGSGIANAAIAGEAVAAVPARRAAMGSGANITARYIGSSIGVAVFATIVAHQGTGAQAVVDGWNTAVLVAGALSLLGAAAVLACRPARRTA